MASIVNQASSGDWSSPATAADVRSDLLVVSRVFVKDANDNTGRSWKWKSDGTLSGSYRFVMKKHSTKLFIDMNHEQVKKVDLTSITEEQLRTLSRQGAIVSGRKVMKMVELQESDLAAVLDVLHHSKVLRTRSGDMGRMDFRFPEAEGTLYYDETTQPPVSPTKRAGGAAYPKVDFRPVPKDALEDVRRRALELEPPHYSERLSHENWIYLRKAGSVSMTERAEKSVYAWNKQSVRSASSMDASDRESIIKRVASLERPAESTITVIRKLKAHGRGSGQQQAMGEVNASAYAAAMGDWNYARTDWQWLHIRGDRLGGQTTPANLVLGTDAANSAMIPIENNILELSELSSKNTPLAITFRALIKGGTSHYAEHVLIEVSAPQGLGVASGAQLLKPGSRLVWRFDPVKGAVFDRLDRDLQWGSLLAIANLEQRREPPESIPRLLGHAPSPPTQWAGPIVPMPHPGAVSPGARIVARSMIVPVDQLLGRFRRAPSTGALLQGLQDSLLRHGANLRVNIPGSGPFVLDPTSPEFRRVGSKVSYALLEASSRTGRGPGQPPVDVELTAEPARKKRRLMPPEDQDVIAGRGSEEEEEEDPKPGGRKKNEPSQAKRKRGSDD